MTIWLDHLVSCRNEIFWIDNSHGHHWTLGSTGQFRIFRICRNNLMNETMFFGFNPYLVLTISWRLSVSAEMVGLCRDCFWHLIFFTFGYHGTEEPWFWDTVGSLTLTLFRNHLQGDCFICFWCAKFLTASVQSPMTPNPYLGVLVQNYYVF